MAHPIGKKHPFKSLVRFITWQLQSMLMPSKLFVKHFIYPVKFYARKKLTGITGNIYTGLHEFDDMGFLLHFLRPGDIFYDIGANVGSYTLLASGVCKAKSVTIEPVKAAFDILTKNIGLNHLQNEVQLLHSGAGSYNGSAIFSSNEDTTNHVIPNNDTIDGETTLTSIIKIDEVFEKSSPALIKIDVEGYETEVLKGMTETLKQPNLKAIIIELNGSGIRYGYDEKDIHQLLLRNGFTPHSYDPFSRKLAAMQSFGSHNTIYCRDIDFITERLINAKSIKVMGEII